MPRLASSKRPIRCADGAGEGPLLVPEQLALEQPGRNGGAIQFHERAFAARAQLVDRARHELLARSGFAGDEHRGIGRRHRLDFAQHAGERAASPDDLLELVLAADLVLEVQLLARQLRVQLLDALVRKRIAKGDRDLTGHARQQRELPRRERIVREGPEVQRAEHAVRRREGHRAGRSDATRHE